MFRLININEIVQRFKEEAKKVPDLTAIFMLLMFSVLIFLLGLFIVDPIP